MKNIAAHMVCHTHWDREWYFTREEFRVKLVRLIDGLLDIVETDPEYVSFMLDGQTIVLEDYLQIRPENRERLVKALKSGKIKCGPWYILPDELLVSGESLIRNYLTGQKVIAGIAEPMQAAYLPDSFGHPRQMPQIIRGLGMDTMIFWRGTADFMDRTEFYWESPHKGTRVLCVQLPCGYGNCARLDRDPDISNPRLTKMIYHLKSRSAADCVLLMNGSDHITGQRDIVEIVKAFNESSRENSWNCSIKLSTLEDFIRDLKRELGLKKRSPELKTYSGEFRFSDRTMLLGGTLSTRMPLKQNNHIVQNTMEKYLEPVLAWEYLSGGRPNMRGYLDYLWKKILENQPHDSICGCSTDAVHAEMMTRFECIKQLQRTLISDAFKRIGKAAAGDGNDKADARLMVFEPVQDKAPSYLETDIDLDKVLVQENNFETSVIADYEGKITHPPLPCALRIVDEQGRELEHRIISARKGYYTYYQDETLPEIYKVNRLRVGMLLPGYDCGFHVFNVYKADETEEKETACGAGTADRTEAACKTGIAGGAESGGDNGITNAYYIVSFEQNAFKVTDKKTGRVYRGVNRFVDKGDAGDEYTYSWPLKDSVYGLDAGSVRIEKISSPIYERLIVSAVLMLPEKLSEDRKSRSGTLLPSPVTITVSLYKDIDRIDFKTDIENHSCDHRLQAEFPSGVLTGVSRAEHCFGITTRSIAAKIPESWIEYPQSTHPAHGVISLSDGEYGLSAVTHGLTEYEAGNEKGQSMLRITLFRSVGWLSRTDLLTRKGNGGWTIETPDAQLLGYHSFEYSITYHRAEDGGKAYALLTKHVYPSAVRQVASGDVRLTRNPLAFISGLPWDVRVSALKISEKGDSLILRLYSLAEEDRKVTLVLPDEVRDVYRVSLAEKRLRELEKAKNELTFTIEPAEIFTLEFVTGTRE